MAEAGEMKQLHDARAAAVTAARGSVAPSSEFRDFYEFPRAAWSIFIQELANSPAPQGNVVSIPPPTTNQPLPVVLNGRPYGLVITLIERDGAGLYDVRYSGPF